VAQKTNSVVLPTANTVYDFQNELTMRRTLERSFADVQDNLNEVTTKVGKEESLAMKRFQFLLMGAVNG
jgi:hypothetical protein|tara:strand:- start:299 stop:505 length:207 start_codon:yes stop_codon:yes gene_type:complete